MNKKIWHELTIIDVIQKRNIEGKSIAYKATKKENAGLVKAASLYFGSWENAIKSAGFDYNNIREDKFREKWTPEKILIKIKELHSQGIELHHNKIKSSHGKVWAAGKRYFGSWQKALEIAGFDYEKEIKKHHLFIWSKDRIISEIQKMVNSGKEINSSSVADSFKTVAGKYFGSYKNAVEAAGFDYCSMALRQHTNWTKEMILNFITSKHNNNEPLNSMAIKKDNEHIYQAANRLFGSWKNAIEYAGLDYKNIKKSMFRTKEMVIDEIQELSNNNFSLNPTIIRNCGHNDLFLWARKYFKSWGNAVNLAGFNYRKILFETNKTFAVLGLEFQEQVKEVFSILLPKMKYQIIYNDCRPDFSDSNNGHWIDAKLQPSGIYGFSANKRTLKYLNNCNKLSIVYLIGKNPKKCKYDIEFINIETYFPELKNNGLTNLINNILDIKKRCINLSYGKVV